MPNLDELFEASLTEVTADYDALRQQSVADLLGPDDFWDATEEAAAWHRARAAGTEIAEPASATLRAYAQSRLEYDNDLRGLCGIIGDYSLQTVKPDHITLSHRQTHVGGREAFVFLDLFRDKTGRPQLTRLTRKYTANDQPIETEQTPGVHDGFVMEAFVKRLKALNLGFMAVARERALSRRGTSEGSTGA